MIGTQSAINPKDRNIKCGAFANFWLSRSIVQRLAAQLTWYQDINLLERLNVPKDRPWYVCKILESNSILPTVEEIEKELAE
jgi:hypothetical protein